MTGPYEATTEYALNTPFHKVIDARYPNSAQNRKTYATREAAEIAAMRLNGKWLIAEADRQERLAAYAA